ncbi:MAG: PQQ-binding-like beta-propeller repeat protein [Verrucomicrobiaceae bacterium]|nr:PQQ-binding-like beta-propeller repeat protein [Verrucomicrobiaceae bacterium]
MMNLSLFSPRRLALLLSIAAASAPAADWPTYRGDAARSGYTAETIPNQLRQRWQFDTGHATKPAWPTSDRMEFDLAFQPIIVGDVVLFGSSADDQVYAMDGKTGAVRWRFFTGGPVRFAPAAWQDRVFVVSDDGYLYALSVVDGHVIWKHQGGPGPEKVIGNERLISHWPARGGPVVWEDAVYYTAGIWPSDGVFVHALDAATGKPRWSNSETGRMKMNQPHGGAEAVSGVAPQGYLLANADALIVPTGRAVPAVFERMDGSLRYYQLQKNQQRGGTSTFLTDAFFMNSGCLFDVPTGELASQQGMGCAVAIPGGVVRADGRSLIISKWKDVEKIDRKGQTQKLRTLEQEKLVPLDGEVRSFIITGSEAVIGGDGQISAIDYNGQRTQWWKQSVEGRVLGLAAANGMLVATTDRGIVYLFDGVPGPRPEPQVAAAPPPPDAKADAEAQKILAASGIAAGYAVVLGDASGALTESLTRLSELQLIVVEPDAALAAQARLRLTSAGVYGSRVTVLVADPAQTHLPKHFANLIIAPQDADPKELARIQRPYGGVICHRKAGEITVEKSGVPPGAGEWTHQNGNAANTLCSDDEIVKGQLSMFWFRDVEFEIANRHGQGPAPLVSQGYMVVSGVNGLVCVDAFNGRLLWEFPLKEFLIDYDGIHHDVGVGDTGGPFCIGGDSVYVKSGARCVRIDLATGKVRGEFDTPVAADAANRNWGYLAWNDGVLFGSVANEGHNVSPRYQMTELRTESVLLFAIDPDSGKQLWQYQPKGSIRHNSIGIAGDRLFLIDRPLVEADHIVNPRREGKSGARLTHSDVPSGTLLALEARTGKVAWQNADDIWGTQISISTAHNVLLMNYKAVRHNFFELPSEVGGRLGGFDLKTGTKLWEQQVKYETRPLINDDKIYAQGGAWDLRTGSPLPWEFSRSYGCGQISASRNMLLFRSATLGYVDLGHDKGTENFGGIRPSCWINAIPASGLVLVPDGASKCHCSYQMKAWFALQGE